MSPLDKKITDIDAARRQESKAYNKLKFCERHVTEQQSQLDTLLQYRKECRIGLKTATETGLTPVHVREYQLLVTHINSVVQVIENKVDACLENFEQAEQVWQRKNEIFEKVKALRKENAIAESQKMLDDDVADNNLQKTGSTKDDGLLIVDRRGRYKK